MEGALNILTFCGLFGTICFCAILVIYAILNWLKPAQTKMQRLNIMAGIAFVVLCILALVHFETTEPLEEQNNRGMAADSTEYLETNRSSTSNQPAQSAEYEEDGKGLVSTTLFFKISRTAIGGLILGTIVISIIALLIVVIRCIFNGIYNLLSIKSSTGKICTEFQNSALSGAFKNTTVILVIALGIFSLFFFLPFLVGEQTKENPIEIWKDGVTKIESIFGFNDEKASSNGTNGDNNNLEDFSSKSVASYTLIFIIILGVGIAVVKILYSIIEQTLKKKKNVNLIDEYSSPIALLAVGIALLMLFQQGDFPKENRLDTIGALLGAFCTVIFIAAIIILTLEIIRLLMDIREDFIRLEARYIFISLVGQSALLLLEMLNSIYGAVNSTVSGDPDNNLLQFNATLRQKIVDAMDDNIDVKEISSLTDQIKDVDDSETTFIPFDENVTKK